MQKAASLRTFRSVAASGAVVLALFWLMPVLAQEVPVRLSFKFILNSSGNRPVGNINTDAEVVAQVVRGNGIFSRFISEFRLAELEIVDAAGISAYYTSEPTEANGDSLRSAAQANPALYHWRGDAINFYINASTGTNGAAISDFPPNNNIVLVSQGAFLTTVAHETGHILNLYHTHQSDGDGCDDTLPDDDSWTSHDQMAMNSFGLVYNKLNASQQYQVDMTWSNLMSYHDPDNRCMLSPCQMDRQSSEAYNDRNWMLTKVPVYVQAGRGGSQSGSFAEPFATIQGAIDYGGLNGKVLVLETGTHPRPTSALATSTDMVTRKGWSTVQEAAAPYSLPYDVENSTNPAVRKAVIAAQECDRRKDIGGVITNLVVAETHAVGREKNAVQLELAQRLRDSGRYGEAAAWFKKLAEQADQDGLRKHARKNEQRMIEQAQAQNPPKTGDANRPKENRP